MGTAQKHFAYAHNIRYVMLCYNTSVLYAFTWNRMDCPVTDGRDTIRNMIQQIVSGTQSTTAIVISIQV